MRWIHARGMVVGIFTSEFLGALHPVVLLPIVMVCPGTHLVENHESQSRTNGPSSKNNTHKYIIATQITQTGYSTKASSD